MIKKAIQATLLRYEKITDPNGSVYNQVIKVSKDDFNYLNEMINDEIDRGLNHLSYDRAAFFRELRIDMQNIAMLSLTQLDYIAGFLPFRIRRENTCLYVEENRTFVQGTLF